MFYTYKVYTHGRRTAFILHLNPLSPGHRHVLVTFLVTSWDVFRSDGESWVSVMGLKPEEALRAPVGRPSPPRARFRAAPPPSAAPQQTDELERERDGSETPVD